jgi:hypothetical protein
VAQDLGGDVDREALGDGFGGEDAAEVVRGELSGTAVGVGDTGCGDESAEESLDVAVVEGDVTDSPSSLEQERQGRAVDTFGAVVAADQR